MSASFQVIILPGTRFPDEPKNHPRFLQRIEQARGSLKAGKGVKQEEIEKPRTRHRR